MQNYADLLHNKFRELVIIGATARKQEVCDYVMEQSALGFVFTKDKYFLVTNSTQCQKFNNYMHCSANLEVL